MERRRRRRVQNVLNSQLSLSGLEEEEDRISIEVQRARTGTRGRRTLIIRREGIIAPSRSIPPLLRSSRTRPHPARAFDDCAPPSPSDTSSILHSPLPVVPASHHPISHPVRLYLANPPSSPATGTAPLCSVFRLSICRSPTNVIKSSRFGQQRRHARGLEVPSSDLGGEDEDEDGALAWCRM